MPNQNATFIDPLRNNSTVGWYNTTDTTGRDVKHDVGVNHNGAIVGLIPAQGLSASIRLVLYSFYAVVLLLGNTLNILAVATTARLRVKTYALTTSLAVADLFLGIWMMIYVAHEATSKTPCDLATFKTTVRPFERFSAYVALLHISAIAIDRYVAVVHPLHYENIMTPSTIRSIIIVIWSAAAIVSMPAYFGFIPSIVPQTCIVTLWPVFEAALSHIVTLWPLFEAVVEVTIYSLNSVVVVLAYARIWSAAMRHTDHHEHVNAQPQQRNACTDGGAAVASQSCSNPLPNSTVESRNVADKWWRFRNLIWKHRSTKTITVLLIMYVVLWLPYVLSRLLGIVSRLPVTSMQTIGSMVGLSHMVLDVFIYGIMNKDFRLAYKRILGVGANVVHQRG